MRKFYTPEDSGAEAFARGELCRAGGLSLTRRALLFCGFAPSSRLADIGCGKGATLRYLLDSGFDASGLDIDPQTDDPRCVRGNASALPYADATMDGLLFECSLSRMENQERALREARRVLKPGGKLIISDLFARNARNGEAVCGGSPPAPFCERQWRELVSKARFKILLFEDKSEELKSLSAQIIWSRGRAGLEELYGSSYDEAVFTRVRVGYFLLVASGED